MADEGVERAREAVSKVVTEPITMFGSETLRNELIYDSHAKGEKSMRVALRELSLNAEPRRNEPTLKLDGEKVLLAPRRRPAEEVNRLSKLFGRPHSNTSNDSSLVRRCASVGNLSQCGSGLLPVPAASEQRARSRFVSVVETLQAGSLLKSIVRRASRVFGSRHDLTVDNTAPVLMGERAGDSILPLDNTNLQHQSYSVDDKPTRSHALDATSTENWLMAAPPQKAKEEKQRAKEELEGALHQQLVSIEGLAEYSTDVYHYLFTQQATLPSDFLLRGRITAAQRSRLVGSLFETYSVLRPRFSSESSFLAVYLVDQTLANGTVREDEWELLVLTALFVAAKMDAQATYCPSLIRGRCDMRDIKAMEEKILKAVDFRLGVTTVLHFMIVLVEHLNHPSSKLWHLAKYIAMIAQCDDALVRLPASLMAGVQLGLACRLVKHEWSDELYALSGHSRDEFAWPYAHLCRVLLDSTTNAHIRGLREFYSDRRHFGVSNFNDYEMDYLKKHSAFADA